MKGGGKSMSRKTYALSSAIVFSITMLNYTILIVSFGTGGLDSALLLPIYLGVIYWATITVLFCISYHSKEKKGRNL